MIFDVKYIYNSTDTLRFVRTDYKASCWLAYTLGSEPGITMVGWFKNMDAVFEFVRLHCDM